jgi:molecular chaperone HtpG
MATKTKSKPATENTGPESIQFSAEIAKVLQLMIHSLYTNKDIFLRELISNASDACDKLRYQAVQDDRLYGDQKDLKITLSLDEKAGTITIADSGIGMNRDDLIANLGTIAKSGTQEFASLLTGDSKKDVSLIGQFGVGFYSSFMIADKVEVHSRKAGEAESWRWISDGSGSFTVEPAEECPRGTSITLHLKKDEKKTYLDRFKLRHIAQTYSDHISFPIAMLNEDGGEEIINTGSAIWARPKSDITDEQYKEFYHHVSHMPDDPWVTLHNKAEGVIQYTSLLYIPSMKPFDLYHPERRRRVKLYVKRVFITDEGVEMVPQYLRFLRGVIDSEDLPLNISRETLQANPMVRKIRDGIVSKVLSELSKKAKKDTEGYLSFWNNFGPVLKEGLCESDAPKEKILDACRFWSTHSEADMVNLEDYISRMKEGQEAIYVITGEDVTALRRSPQLEGFRKYGLEVLLLADHVDDFWVSVNPKYKEKPFKSVARAGDDLKKFMPASEEKQEEEAKTEKPDVSALIDRLKALYGDAVREVRATDKLSESPVCIGIGAGDMELRLERFLLENKQLQHAMPKILEINPEHPVITKLAATTDDAAFERSAWLLLDQAKLLEGEVPADPAAFAKRLNALLS